MVLKSFPQKYILQCSVVLTTEHCKIYFWGNDFKTKKNLNKQVISSEMRSAVSVLSIPGAVVGSKNVVSGEYMSWPTCESVYWRERHTSPTLCGGHCHTDELPRPASPPQWPCSTTPDLRLGKYTWTTQRCQTYNATL